MSEPKLSFDINGIKRCQRNRHPVLLIDQVVDVVPGKSAHGIKCFSYNEWFFPGHFDDEPNVPGFVQLECLVQTFIMTFLCLDAYRGMKTNFASIDNVKFRRNGHGFQLGPRRAGLQRGVRGDGSRGVCGVQAEVVGRPAEKLCALPIT